MLGMAKEKGISINVLKKRREAAIKNLSGGISPLGNRDWMINPDGGRKF